MAQPKKPLPIPKISCTAIQGLRAGESCIVGPCSPSQVSAMISQCGGAYAQQMVLVIEPRAAICQKMFVVTRQVHPNSMPLSELGKTQCLPESP